jgi:aldose 1-epimerase
MPTAPADGPFQAYHGSIIAPWPNRVRDGKYSFQGSIYELETNEESTGTALHGYSAALDWDWQDATDDSVTLATTVGGTSGYPWQIQLKATYQLDNHGLNLRISASNLSSEEAPFGFAFHPYFLIPDAIGSNLKLRTSANTVVIPDDDRLLPLVEKRVERTPFDFRKGRSADLPFLDHAFSEFEWDKNGYTAADVYLEKSYRLRISWDYNLNWLQLHRPLDPKKRPSLVVEPMTCPPDALNSGRDLVLLGPGEEIASHLNIRVSTN